ncbi:MAG: O-antigen ligase family protein [Candidatus Colwellbacteria bacterium]|nr:O-antigen ligase family protein [Candidatus Colwellbacteria bacterium]
MLVGAVFVPLVIKKFTIYDLRFTIYEKDSLPITGITFLFLGLLIGIFVSSDMQTSLGVFKGWFLAPVLFAITTRSVLVEEKQKQKALWSLALSGISVAVISFFYWIFGWLTFDGRLAAFYESPNMLAMYVTPALLIVTLALTYDLRLTTYDKKLINNKSLVVGRWSLVVFSFSFLIFSLVMARSLGAFIGITAAGLFYLSTLYWGKYMDKLGRIVIVSIIFIGILLPFPSILFNPWEMGRTSLASRLMIWQASVEMLKNNWLFGIGPGMFQETYLAYQKNFSPFLEWAVPHPHNIFLATWLYGGLIGLVGLLLILFWFFSKLQKISTNIYQYLLLSIIIYLLIHGTIDNTLWRNDMAMVFWMMMALRR